MNEAVGLIVAALIAGLVAFFSLIISKEQTVSGFRQAWIDALREDIAALISCVFGLHGAIVAKGESETTLEAQWDMVKPYYVRIAELSARIRLRLNPNEEKPEEKIANAAVLNALKELDSKFGPTIPEFEELEAIVGTLVSNAHVILKENWDLVRSGERTYVIVKNVALGTVAAIVLLSLWWTYSN